MKPFLRATDHLYDISGSHLDHVAGFAALLPIIGLQATPFVLFGSFFVGLGVIAAFVWHGLQHRTHTLAVLANQPAETLHELVVHLKSLVETYEQQLGID